MMLIRRGIITSSRCLLLPNKPINRSINSSIYSSSLFSSIKNYSSQSTTDWPKQLSLLRNIIKDGFNLTSSPQSHRITCFVRSVRKHAKVTFLAVSDGSLIESKDGNSSEQHQQSIQAVLSGQMKKDFDAKLTPGTALELVVEVQQSKGRGQNLELSIKNLILVGESDSASYPLRLDSSEQKSYDPSSDSINQFADRMRRFAHLRSRDLRHAAILRSRDIVENVISSYFRSQDFVKVVAPILTSSDCEGGGEVFRVESSSDFSKTDRSFWSDSKAFLTVSAQLHLESMALGLGRVYTVGPSFRAEGSATNRHLAEFWMCEGEQMTSVDVGSAMNEVTDVVENLIRESIKAFMSEKNIVKQLWRIDSSSDEKKVFEEIKSFANGSRWQRITYTEAIAKLAEAKLSSPPPQWGDSLSSEQERWLAKEGPIFVTDYPSSDKPFYMLLNEDKKTVACFDLLVPRIGELVGGSLRETRSSVLQERIMEMANKQQQQHQEGEHPIGMLDKLTWYTDDLRKYGCNPHGGFGLGIERLLSWITNTDSVRDVITFPRVKGPIHF